MKGSVDATNEVVHFAYQYTGFTPLLELKYILGELMVFEMTGRVVSQSNLMCRFAEVVIIHMLDINTCKGLTEVPAMRTITRRMSASEQLEGFQAGCSNAWHEPPWTGLLILKRPLYRPMRSPQHQILQ